MDDDQRLEQRIVLAIDTRQRMPNRAPSGVAWRLAPLALAVAGAIVLLLVIPLATSSRPAAQPLPQTFSDDFSAGIDGSRWTAMGAGTGNSVTAANGAIELMLAADARPGADGYMNANLWTQRCVARGDYDVSVDYRLLDWPAANGARLVLGEFPPGNATVGRRQIGDRDEYDASDEHVSAGRMTVDEQGSLRLVRRGTTVTASYRSSDDQPWTALSTQLTSRFDATFQIFLFSGGNDPFGGKKVRVGVDNFHLSASTLVCG